MTIELETSNKQREIKGLLSPLGQFLEYLLAFHAQPLRDQELQECDLELAEIVAGRLPSPPEAGTLLQALRPSGNFGCVEYRFQEGVAKVVFLKGIYQPLSHGNQRLRRWHIGTLVG